MVSVYIAAFVYSVTALLGLAAWLRKASFGKWHHAMFAASVVTSILAFIVYPSWYGGTATIALLTMPFCPARTPRHKVVGVSGWAMYIIGIATSH